MEKTVSRIEQIRKLLAQSPNDTFLLYSLGMEQLSQGSPHEAAATFDRVLELDENYLPAYTQGAAARRQAGDLPAAAAMLEKALALANRQGDTHAADRISLLLEALRPAS